MHAYMGVCKMQRCSFLFVFLIEGVSEYALIFFPLQWSKVTCTFNKIHLNAGL